MRGVGRSTWARASFSDASLIDLPNESRYQALLASTITQAGVSDAIPQVRRGRDLLAVEVTAYRSEPCSPFSRIWPFMMGRNTSTLGRDQWSPEMSLRRLLEVDPLARLEHQEATPLQCRFGSRLPKEPGLALLPFVERAPWRYWDDAVVDECVRLLESDLDRTANAFELRAQALDRGFDALFRPSSWVFNEQPISAGTPTAFVPLMTGWVPDTFDTLSTCSAICSNFRGRWRSEEALRVRSICGLLFTSSNHGSYSYLPTASQTWSETRSRMGR